MPNKFEMNTNDKMSIFQASNPPKMWLIFLVVIHITTPLDLSLESVEMKLIETTTTDIE